MGLDSYNTSPGESRLFLLKLYEAEVRRYLEVIEKGAWTPADDERLVRLVIPGWKFPWDSVPPESELAAGCEKYQRERAEVCDFPDAPCNDAPGSRKIAYYEERIRAIAARRGQDLCHETDGLGQLLAGCSKREYGRLNAPYEVRCTFCALYRNALYSARQNT